MTTRSQRKSDFLESDKDFRKEAFLIIYKLKDLSDKGQDKTRNVASPLMDEILHSIFFLGVIRDPPYSPESILAGNEDLLKDLKSRYPWPFQLYSRQLPRRSPFSCVLDMMVRGVGQDKEQEIRDRLRQLITEIEDRKLSEDSSKKSRTKNYFISSTICISQKSNDAVRHYGVSMSTSGADAGRIVVAASCFSAWDDYVAGAVMTYDPEKSKREYFDGTIKIPDCVRCEAFNIKSGRQMNPCKSCGNMFHLNTNERKVWPYGNCAEVESLSNLLKNEAEVKKKSQPTSNTWTSENIERVKEDVLKELQTVLKRVHFKWDGNFYTPQAE